jgi:RNA polymerase sigma factor (sigma-70 family)
LSSLFAEGATGSLTDGQLLDRFVGRGGEGAERAFASLVGRHGPLVLRACRSILRDEHAAHDAFQATFLVLASKARSLVVADSLAPWLHAVACRVAMGARSAEARRRRHERARGERSPLAGLAPDDAEGREVGAVLHEEIEALPERYRVPIVLCDLEGRSHDEAARHLGWPVGTVKSRQARGRDRLKARLTRRGVAPSFGVGLGIQEVVSPGLADRTASLAAKVKAGGLGVASAPVARLAKEVAMTMGIGKLKWAGLAFLGAVLATSGALTLARPGVAPAPGSPRAAPLRALVSRDRAGLIYFHNDGGLASVDPVTGVQSRVLLQCKIRPRISPDGRLIAYEWDGAIWVRELDKADGQRKILDLDGSEFGAPACWSPDGSKLIVSLGQREKPGDTESPWRSKTVRVNVDGTGREDLNIPPEDFVHDWGRGDWLITSSQRNAKVGWQLYVMKTDGSEIRQLFDGYNPFYTRFSPDGKRILFADGGTPEGRGIFVVNFDGTGRRKIVSADGEQLWSGCWSPDGKRIAVAIIHDPNKNRLGHDRLVIQAVDGEERSEFPLEDVKMTGMPDWR